MTTYFYDTNLIRKMAATKPKEGSNRVHAFTKKGERFQLNAIVKNGKIIRWQIRSNKRRTVPTVYVRTVAATKGKTKTTCWQCGVDADGNRHCWIIPCPKGPFTPWPTAVP